MEQEGVKVKVGVMAGGWVGVMEEEGKLLELDPE